MFSRQLPLLSHIEQVEVVEARSHPIQWEYDPDRGPWEWRELFRMLIAVQNLLVCQSLMPLFEAILEDVAEDMDMEALLALRKLSLEGLRLQSSGSVPEGIKSFVAARETSGLPVITQSWKRRQMPEPAEDSDSESDESDSDDAVVG